MRLWRRLLDPEPPMSAIEVRASGVAGLRLVREGKRLALGAAASLELAAGVLRVSLTEPNIVAAAAFRDTLRAAAERVGLLAGARVALVLPDPVARVSLVPAAEVKARSRKELEELLRFRIRKSLPFDVQHARIAFAEVPAAPGRPAALLVAAAHEPIIAAYEQALREVALEPGLVELSALSLMASRSGTSGDELLINWDDEHASLIVLRDGEPILIRTLIGELQARPEEVAREVQSTLLYYQERLGGTKLARVLVRSRNGEAAADALRDVVSVAPEAIDPWREIAGAPRSVEAALLAGAAASLLARAA